MAGEPWLVEIFDPVPGHLPYQRFGTGLYR